MYSSKDYLNSEVFQNRDGAVVKALQTLYDLANTIIFYRTTPVDGTPIALIGEDNKILTININYDENGACISLYDLGIKFSGPDTIFDQLQKIIESRRDKSDD